MSDGTALQNTIECGEVILDTNEEEADNGLDKMLGEGVEGSTHGNLRSEDDLHHS